MDADLNLIQQYARSHDAEAFADIVERYQDFVYGVCLRIHGEVHGAEDSAQECFLKLARDAGAVRASLGGWLHRCAMRVALKAVRRQKSRKRTEEAYTEMKGTDEGSASWQEIAPHVDQAMDELPDELRSVLVEHFLHQRPQSELAADLDVSPATVSRRVQSGLEETRKKLRGWGVICTAGALSSLLVQNAAHAAPATLTAALGKLAISGVGKSGVAGGIATAFWTFKVKLLVAAAAAMLALGGAFMQCQLLTGTPTSPPLPKAVAQVEKSEEQPPEEPAAKVPTVKPPVEEGKPAPPARQESSAPPPAVDGADVMRKALEHYQRLRSYSAQGMTISHLITGKIDMIIESTFSIKLGRPMLYNISWSQNQPSMVSPRSAVWNAGQGPYLYMGMMKAYAKQANDELALGAATGISGGAANTIPSIFFPRSGILSQMTDLKFERLESIAGESCYVLSGRSPVSTRHTFWISRERLLFLKMEYSLGTPSKIEVAEATDAQIDEAIKMMGAEPTKERRERMRAMMRAPMRIVAKLRGKITEIHADILTDAALAAKDFEYTVPTGTKLIDSLFGNVFDKDILKSLKSIDKLIDTPPIIEKKKEEAKAEEDLF